MPDCLTIFTDASYCSDSRAGGGAFWSRSYEQRFKGSFPLKDLRNSGEAEILTVAHAIQRVFAHTDYQEFISKQPLVVVVSDYLEVKRTFHNPKASSVGELVLGEVFSALETMEGRGCPFKINHVKAHQGGKALSVPRNWVNNWCDAQAKQQMRALRARLTNGAHAK